MDIKAIETTYKGYRFRSRLEARWAVFFDALEIAWEYEPEGYVLTDGTTYLPDFYLTEWEMFVEVKPDGGDFTKAKQLCRDLKKPVWMAEGVPTYRAWIVASTDAVDGYGEMEAIPLANQAEGENRMYWAPYEFITGDSLDVEETKENKSMLGGTFCSAIERVRSCRFDKYKE